MPCGKNTLQCQLNPKKEPLPVCCRKNLIEIFQVIEKVFTENDIPYWLDYGSLLGAVREKGIIKNDDDGDISILRPYMDKVLSLSDKFRSLGFHVLTYYYPDFIRIDYSRMNELHVDIFGWHPDMKPFKFLWEPDSASRKTVVLDRMNYFAGDNIKGKHFPVEMLFPLQRTQFENMSLPCPHNPEEFVAFRYGKDWQIPKVM